MDSIGFGIEEILVVAVLVLLLFGPKGMGKIMRDLGRVVGKMKKYRDEFSRELMAMSEPVLTEAEIMMNERKRIRTQYREMLKTRKPEENDKEAPEVYQKLFALDQYRTAKRLFTYVSMGNELDTRGIIRVAMAEGKEVYVPACQPADKSLKLARLRSLETDLVPGTHNIPEPKPELLEDIDPLTLDFFIIPGLSFDRDCNRMGRGGGYFDRFLKTIKGKRPIVAVAYNSQRYPYSIPRLDHDIRPDKVLTAYETLEDPECRLKEPLPPDIPTGTTPPPESSPASMP
jgi:5-formyltetrahydrofolate cyclo-ligase